MKELSIRVVIREFIESINEDWIRRKEKEFKNCPLYNSEINGIEIPNQFFDEVPIYGYDKNGVKLPISMDHIPREMKYNLKKYCVEYYNDGGDLSTSQKLDYQLIGLCELEKSGKNRLRPIQPNIKMIIETEFIPFFSRYFEASKTSKIGIIRAVEEFNSMLNEEINSFLSTSTKKTTILVEIIKSIPGIVSLKLEEKYFLEREAHTRPFHSKLTLDFNLNKGELVAFYYLLVKCGIIVDTPDNLDFLFEHFRFNKKRDYHLIPSKTSLTNLLGEIKNGKTNPKGTINKKYKFFEDIMYLFQETIFKLKTPK